MWQSVVCFRVLRHHKGFSIGGFRRPASICASLCCTATRFVPNRQFIYKLDTCTILRASRPSEHVRVCALAGATAGVTLGASRAGASTDRSTADGQSGRHAEFVAAGARVQTFQSERSHGRIPHVERCSWGKHTVLEAPKCLSC